MEELFWKGKKFAMQLSLLPTRREMGISSAGRVWQIDVGPPRVGACPVRMPG